MVQSMNQRLTAYDSVDRDSHTLAAIAAEFGQSWQAIRSHHNFGFNGTKITRGIELERKFKGKVFVRIDDGYTDPNGNQHPNITFSLNGGSATYTHKCWESFKESRHNANFTRQHAPIFITHKPTQPAANDAETARKLAQFQKLLDGLQTLPEERGDFAYWVTKFGTNSELAVLNKNLRRGVDRFGDFNIYGLSQTIGGEICCIQKIGANGFKTIHNAYESAKTGAFFIVGNIRQAHKGLWFAEGLATAITVNRATGLPVAVCLDAGNLPIVVKKFADFGYKDLRIAADNDSHEDATKINTGIKAAFEAAKAVRAAAVYVPFDDGKKCDFNDLEQSKGLGAVKIQLHKENALQFENGALYVNKKHGKTAEKRREYERYYLQLCSQICPEQRENNRAKILRSLVEDYPRHYSLETACFKAEKILTFEQDKQKLHDEIRQAYQLKKETVKRRNSLTNADLRSLHKLDLANSNDVAKLHNIARYDRATFIDFRAMASNKTGFAGEVIENDLDGLSTLFIVPLASLADNVSGRLDTAHYKKTSAFDLRTAQKVTVCINSILRNKNKPPSKEFQHCFVDEIRRVVENILDGATMPNSLEIFNELKAFINASRLSWFCDADLNSETLDFIRNAAPDKPIYYIVDSRPRKFKLPPVTYRGGSLDNLRIEIAERIKKGQKIYVFCDSLAEVRKTKNYLKSQGIKEIRILDDDKILLEAHGKNKGDKRVQDFLSNPDEFSKDCDVAIVSPIVQCGFSICNGHFDAVIGLLGSGACTSNELAQSLFRVRDTKEIVIGITPQKNRNRVESFAMLSDGEINMRHLVSGKISEDGATFELDELTRRDLKALIQRNADLNDLENATLLHLENIGFEVTHAIPEPAKIQKIEGLAKEVKAEQANEIKKARSITSVEFITLSAKQQNFTSEESNIYDRHMVEDMVGATAHTDAQLEQLNNQPDDVITDDDIANYQNGMLARILNRELMSMDVEDLREIDEQNQTKGKRKRRKLFMRNLIDKLMDAVEVESVHKSFVNEKTGEIKASSHSAFDYEIAEKICDEVLRANCADLAINGFADYSKPIERPVSTLRNIFKLYGFKINTIGRDGGGKRSRWFEVIEDQTITECVNARAENRKTNPSHNSI